MAHIAIIGAGLTGLATAYYLEQNGHTDYALYEAESLPGGLCRSVRTGGFTFDYTGHLLHTAHPRIAAVLEKVLPHAQLHAINRQSAVFSCGTYTPYPYQTHLHGLPTQVVVDCVKGFVERPAGQRGHALYAWLRAHFGDGFVNHFFAPYQEKLMGCALTQQTDCWARHFIPQPTLEQVVRGAVSAACDESLGYHAHFQYPKAGGIDVLVNALVGALSCRPHLNHQVTRIDVRAKKIHFTSGKSASYDVLANTMPLDRLLACLEPAAATRWARQAAAQLRARAVLNVNVMCAKPLPRALHWLYVPERTFPFYRIGFPSVLSSSMAPAGCSSFALEIACEEHEMPALRQAAHDSVETACAVLGVSKNACKDFLVLDLPCAYVRYDRWRRANLPRVLKRLAEEHIFSIGRYGAWKYASMHDAFIDAYAFVAAQQRGLSNMMGMPKVRVHQNRI